MTKTQIADRPQIPAEFADARTYLAYVVAQNAGRIYGSPLPEAVANRLRDEHDEFAEAHAIFYLLAYEEAGMSEEPTYLTSFYGSVAGSIVAYVLGLIQYDPIEHAKLFELYLESVSGNAPYPDIDLNFEQGKTDEVMSYLSGKYGVPADL